MDRPRASIGREHDRREHQRSPAHSQILREPDRTPIHTTKSNLLLPPPVRKEDLVRRWLAQTEDDEQYDTRTGVAKYKRKHREISQSPQTAALARREASYQDEKRRSKPRRKRRYSDSPDSSLLDDVFVSQLDPRARTKPQVEQGNNDDAVSHLERESIIERHTPKQSKTRPEIFEKRPRHKTREDLYEPKDKTKNSASHTDQGRRRTKRETKREKRRATRKAGEDLMNNFSSGNIENDRLTLRPSNGLGLFNNGRASSPQRTRGIPDLASSKMSFFKQPSRAPAMKNQDKVGSKSHDKERRRTEREQLEISTFFQPQRSLDQIEPSARDESLPTFIREESTQRRQKSSDHYVRRHRNLSRTNSLGPDDSRSDQHGKLREVRTPPNLHHSIPITSQESYSSDGTAVTWSDSHRSPTTNSRYLRNANKARTSPIPDAIRRALEETGIFRDTGLESAGPRNYSRETTSSDERTALRELPSEAYNKGGSTVAICARPLKPLSESRERHRELLEDDRSSSASASQTIDKRVVYTCRLCAKHSCHMQDTGKDILSNEVDVEVLTPDTQRDLDPTSAPTEIVQCSKGSPGLASPQLSRQQLAEKARVRQHPISQTNSKAAEIEKRQNKTDIRSQSPRIPGDQDQGDQPILCTSTAPEKDNAAPDDLPSGPIMENECQDEGKMQQLTHPEQNVIAQPDLETCIDPLAPPYPISDPIQKEHSVTDNPAGLYPISQGPASDTTAQHLTISHPSDVYDNMGRTLIQSSRALPRTENPLPDLIRYQQMEGLQTPFEEYCDYGLQGNHFEHDKSENMPHGEYVARGYWEQDYPAAPLDDNAHIYDRPSDDYELQGDYHQGQSPFCELVEEYGQFPCQDMDDSELWLAGENAWLGDQMAEDIMAVRTSNPSHREPGNVVDNNQHHAEDEEALLGFWRPHTHY